MYCLKLFIVFHINLSFGHIGPPVFEVRAWTVGDECRQVDDAKRDRLMQERFAAEHPRRVGAGLRDLEL